MHYETVIFMVSAASIQFCILSPKIGLETFALKVWDALALILRHNVSKQENSPLARNGEIVILMALFFYEQGDGPSFSWASPDQRDAEMSIALGEGREFTKSKDVRMRKGIYIVVMYMKNRWASRMVLIFLR